MVVHPVSHGVSRVPRYSGSRRSVFIFGYGALTLYSRPSHAVLLITSDLDVCPQPRRINPPVWPLPIPLAATLGISFDFSSSAYLDVSVQRVYLSIPILFSIAYQSIALMGSPIRKSTDYRIFAPPRGLSQLVTSFFGS